MLEHAVRIGEQMIRANTSSFGSGLPRGAAACVMLFLVALPSFAQNAPPASPAPPPPAYRPGMLDSVGRWFKDSYNYISGNVEGARNTMGGIGERAGSAAKDAANAATSAASNAATAAKDATVGAVGSLPGTRVVNGKERCDSAPNGAPDCRHAAEAVCRAKGFTAGSSLDIQSAKDCPTEAYIRRDTRECKVASFVVRAVCQ
jgi:hypothetical protein